MISVTVKRLLNDKSLRQLEVALKFGAENAPRSAEVAVLRFGRRGIEAMMIRDFAPNPDLAGIVEIEIPRSGLGRARPDARASVISPGACPAPPA